MGRSRRTTPPYCSTNVRERIAASDTSFTSFRILLANFRYPDILTVNEGETGKNHSQPPPRAAGYIGASGADCDSYSPGRMMALVQLFLPSAKPLLKPQ
ncbi:MAG: hypothetical protein M3Z24_13655 [Chloroflexota bacterium]|nr:hypothetical protein [Chloroflexota bacterium]